ncbi:MAG: hypothetical protein IT372_30865 [Polyangiaceae bacterium]|nr:hypothetical protein [Polyangiaceae bacterium]
MSPRPLPFDLRHPAGALVAAGVLVALSALAPVPGCAEGNDLPPPSGLTTTSTTTTTSTSGGGQGGAGGATTTTSTSGGGHGGTGGAGGQGGAGGDGGAGTTTTSTTGGGGAGGDGGGPTDTVLLLAGGGASMLGGEYHPASGWITAPIAEQTAHGPAVALVGSADGVGLFRSSSSDHTSQLMSVTWTAGAWSSPASLGGGAVTTQSRPALVASAGKAHAVFHGNNFNHYYLGYDPAMGNPWTPVELVGLAGSPAFGPTPPAVTAFAGDPVACYAGSNSDLYHHTRAAGAWTGGYGHLNGMAPFVTNSPAIAALSAGAEMLIVFLEASSGVIYWTKGSAASWTPAAVLSATALSNEPVALAPLPGGEAVMAYRGQNGQIYWSRYAPAGNPPWSVPAPLANPNPSIASPPALAPGVGGASAELAYVDSATGAVYHSRLIGSAWTAPQSVGGSGLTHASISSAP